MLAVEAFDRNCLDCRRGEPHMHVRQTHEVGPGGRVPVKEFEPVYQPDEIIEVRAEWRWYRKGRGRRPLPLRDRVAR